MQISFERAPGDLFRPYEPRPRGSEILGDQLALGDVDGRDEEKRPLVDLGERRACPRHRQPSPGLRHPRVVVLLRRLARRDAGDRFANGITVVRVDERLPEDLPADLSRLVLEGALERDVGAAVGQHAVGVDQAKEARRVVRDRIQKRALAVVLGLEPLALRDIGPADEDEPIQPTRDVRDGDRRPDELARAPVGRSKRGLDLLGGATGSRRRDGSRRSTVVVFGDDVEKMAPDDVLVGPAHGLLECCGSLRHADRRRRDRESSRPARGRP